MGKSLIGFESASHGVIWVNPNDVSTVTPVVIIKPPDETPPEPWSQIMLISRPFLAIHVKGECNHIAERLNRRM